MRRSAASDVSLARFGLRIIRAMQPSAALGKTAECVDKRSSASAATDGSDVAIAVTAREEAQR